VLATLARTPGLAGTLVVTADGQAATHARAAGARVIDDGAGAGLNAALDSTVTALVFGQAGRMLVLPADVPLVTPASLVPLLAAEAGVTLVPDRAGTGTNALLMAPVGALPFRFGPSSLARHREEAAARGLPVRVLEIPELALDIDTPYDLNALLAMRAAGGTARRRA